MRYNSLRSQLNWHSKQQNHLFKKLNKPTADKQPPLEEAPPLVDHTRGHELMWLEKMMRELHQYKEEGKEGVLKQQRQGQSVDVILKEKCRNASHAGRICADRPQKVGVAVEESAKSSKKIKFEIVMHSDKPPSAKKTVTSEPKQKPKSVKKTPIKSTGKKSMGEKQSVVKEASTSMREVAICCPSNTKVIEVGEMKTDPCSFQEADLKILEHLWRKESENGQKEVDKMSLTSKKSVGKIIRNSDKLNKTCLEPPKQKENSVPPMASRQSAQTNQNSSYKQCKDSWNKQSISINSFESRDLQSDTSKDIKSNEPPHPFNIIQKSPKQPASTPKQECKLAPKKSKAKYEKIYIKLETEKLSEYLCEKSERVEEKQKIIETNQYQKYCQTNRVEVSTTSASINMPSHDYKSQTAQKLFRESQIPKKDELGPRAKSQQRKFNKCAQTIKHSKCLEPDNAKQDTPSSSQANPSRAAIPENRTEIKLKRRYDYQEDPVVPPAKGQKLFTLHSVSSDHSDKQTKEEPVVIIPIPQQPTQEEQPSINIGSPSKQPQHNSDILSHQPSAEAMDDIQQSFYLNEQPSKDPTQELTLLFNFLDEGHRGLLTDTNCQHQSLTEDLKLLFSAILNQIRTKKRFYNLQRFVQESKKVLEVKNEVYMHNHCKSPQQKDMVYLSLRQNVDILRKKFPLMFVKCTFTQSCSQASNINSKKSSFTHGQSLVIDRVQIERKSPKNDQNEGLFKNGLQEKANPQGNIIQINIKNAVSSIDSKWTRRDKENAELQENPRRLSKKLEENGELDMLEPQIYLQKKYGLMKSQEESDKMSSILQRTRGYLDNLDTYLKIR